jgi:hypothetical protein
MAIIIDDLIAVWIPATGPQFCRQAQINQPTRFFKRRYMSASFNCTA